MGIETLPTPERLSEDVELIKTWLAKQPHLPQIDDDDWLLSILRHNKYSLEKTKIKLENYFTFRTKYPEMLKNRDPTSTEIAQARAAYKVAYADNLTKNGELVIFGQPQPDTSIFDIVAVQKFLFMCFDLAHLRKDGHEHAISVTDCRYLSYVHFMKALPRFKLAADVFFSGYSERVKSVHVINPPASLEKVFNTVKGFFPKKIAERFYVHPTLEDFCKVVDENVVCSDFGGKGPRFDEYCERTQKQLEEHRDWYLSQDEVCSNEDLRRKSDNIIEDMNGSFRKLEVD